MTPFSKNTMLDEAIHVSRADGVTTITLSRPDKLNAFAGSMREELLSAIESVAADLRTRVVILTGAGRGFCAGGDVAAMAEMKKRDAPFREVAHNLDLGRRIVMAIRSMERPVIAAVNGPATGAGLSLALACDLRIASEAATFGATFSRLGLHPDWGATYFLPRIIGVPNALRMIWTGEVITASEAFRIGLVDQVVPADDLMNVIHELAGKLAEAPPVTISWAKRVLCRSLQSDLNTVIGFEMEAQQACWESPDSAEGLESFEEGRAPHFRGLVQ